MKAYHWPLVVVLEQYLEGEAIAMAETKEQAIEQIAINAKKRILANRTRALSDSEEMWILSLKDELRETAPEIFEGPCGFAIDGSV